MQITEYLYIKKNQDFLIKIIKIIIIGFVSFSLIASAIPFYLCCDERLYGISSINLSKGNFEITNELFQQTGDSQFIPKSFVSTINNTAIPKSSVGLYTVGAISYLIGGFSGLLYFNPIITILLLISFERITTKFFGNRVCLLALLMVVADWHIHLIGLRFATHHIFSLFFILGTFSLIKYFHNRDEKYILLCSSFFAISTFFRINGIVAFPLEIVLLLGFLVKKNLNENNGINKNKSIVFLIRQKISKFNYRKLFKVCFFLLLPWIIFLSFWFSFNDHYFGDPTTNYREQARKDTTALEQEPVVPRIVINPEEMKNLSSSILGRINLVQYYLVPLIPDPLYFTLIISSDTDLDLWRSDVWISYVTFSVLLITLIFSLYFKINRIEILTILLFIFGIVAFYSSPLTSDPALSQNLSEHANSRYMIPASLLSFILIGFILVKSWDKIFPKKSNRNQKLIKSLKLFYLLVITTFFSALIVVMPSIQDFYQTGFHFNNPLQYSKSYEELEKLPDKSLIVGYGGGKTLLHTDTHFYPYGKKFIENQGNPKNVPIGKIELLKEILKNGYTAYAFKNSMFLYDSKYFKFLEAEHGIILIDYSQTFCKLESISENKENTNNISSDPICFADIVERPEKIWDVTLKWD